MRRAQIIFLFCLLLLGQSLMYAQARPTGNSPLPPIGQRATISVTDLTGGVTANDLVQNLVGGGVATSNIVYTGSNLAAGVYLGGTQAGLGIDGGIILSTGGAM
ncbi:MAG: choice-of-anchor L domain-containing protein, partial [Candidatus Cloacimonadaceae bacterium]